MVGAVSSQGALDFGRLHRMKKVYLKTRRSLCLLALALFTLAACKKSSPPPARTPAAAPLDQPSEVAASSQGPYVLTSEALGRFLAYQKDMLQVYRGLAHDVGALEAATDGGSAAVGTEAMRDSLHLLERRAKAEEIAREKAKLSARDVTEIERMVGAVLSKRKLSATLPLDQTIAQFESLEAKLPKDQQLQIEKSIAELKAQKADVENLTDEKKQYGEANVKLILAHEQALAAGWDAWVSALTGGRAN